MGEIVNPALAGMRKQRNTRIPDLRAQVDAWSARNDLRTYTGSLREVSALVPAFDRRSLGRQDLQAQEVTRVEQATPHLDVVVRRAGPGVGLLEMPVGVVTRRHQLLPHARVIECLDQALGVVHADPAHVQAQLDLTNFGARMSLSVDLPAQFDFVPDDGEALGLRILLTNSVNGGGLRLMAVWQQRSSGCTFPVSVTGLESRLVQRLPLRLADIVPAVQKAIAGANADRQALASWRRQLVTRDRLVTWADGSIRRMWGWRAAARIFHIAMTGWDAEPAFSVERVLPTRRTMQATDPVPAAPAFVETLYDAMLAVAWVARDARDNNARMDRIAETTVLMRSLLREGRKSSAPVH